MHIALVSMEYPSETGRGGIGTQTHAKAHGLAAIGHEIDVITRSAVGPRREYDEGPVRVTRLPGSMMWINPQVQVVDWLSHGVEVAGALAHLHRRHPIDLAEFPEWASEGYVHLVNRGDTAEFPAVVQLHGPLVMLAHTLGWPPSESLDYRVGTAMEGLCVQSADAVYSSSHCSADWCRRYYGLGGRAIPRAHVGVDTQLFKPAAAVKDSYPSVVAVGRVTRNKGADVLVEACSELAKEWPDLRLRMVGRVDPEFSLTLRSFAEARGCHDLLEFVAPATQDELPGILARSHVFALPSAYEGGPGFAYLEAMSCGLPVVGCAGSGVAEIVTPGSTGVLVPPKDVVMLTAALRQLLADETTRLDLGNRARAFVVEHLDRRACLHRLERLYHAIVAGADIAAFSI